MTPYRQRGDGPAAGGEDELVYAPREAEPHVGPLRRAAQLLLGATTLSGVLLGLGHPELAVAALIGAGVLGVRRWRGETHLTDLVLRVDGGELQVLSGDARRTLTTVRLSELRDVSLDRRTIRKVTGGAGAVPALRNAEATIGPEIDWARIVLVPDAPRAEIELTDGYSAYVECVDSLGRIRTFLRAHGWVPEDERAA